LGRWRWSEWQRRSGVGEPAEGAESGCRWASERREGDEDGEMRALARDRGKTGVVEAAVAELDERVGAALTRGAGVFGVSNAGQRGERCHEEFAALGGEQPADRDRALERGRDVEVAALVPRLLR